MTMISSGAPSTVLVLVALGSAGCGSAAAGSGDAPGTLDGNGGSAGTIASPGGGGGSGAGGKGNGETSCPSGPGYAGGGTPQLVAEVSGRVFDQWGAPAANVPVQVCGLGACSNLATTSDQGVVCTLDKQTGLCAPGLSPGLEITRPAFKYGLGVEHVKFAQLLPAAGPELAMGDLTTVTLPDVAQGVELVPGASASSNGLTLTLAEGATIAIDVLVFDTPELERFRAAEIPLETAPPAVDKSAGFEILIGTAPNDTELCPHASLSVPNTPSWPPGTEVEFWVHGVDLNEEWAPYGGWGKVSGGRVSSDGSHVVTHEGEGVPILGIFGIKKH